MKHYLIRYIDSLGYLRAYNCTAVSEKHAIEKYHRYVGYYTIKEVSEQ